MFAAIELPKFSWEAPLKLGAFVLFSNASVAFLLNVAVVLLVGHIIYCVDLVIRLESHLLLFLHCGGLSRIFCWFFFRCSFGEVQSLHFNSLDTRFLYLDFLSTRILRFQSLSIFHSL